MEDWAGKLLLTVAGGIIGGAITSAMNYYLNLKQRRLTLRLAEKKELDEFLEAAAIQLFDADRLMNTLEELHGSESITENDLDALFKIHNVDVLASNPVFLQKGTRFLSPPTLHLQESSKDRRSSLFVLYKESLFHREDSKISEVLTTLHGLIQETHRSLAAATEALRREAAALTARKAT